MEKNYQTIFVTTLKMITDDFEYSVVVLQLFIYGLYKKVQVWHSYHWPIVT